MRLLVSWLRDFVEIDADPQEIAGTLSMCGFEVASIDPAPPSAPGADGSPAQGLDAVIDFEITANRPDCLSVAGLAREAATAFDRPLRGIVSDRSLSTAPPGAPSITRAAATASLPGLSVTVEDPDLCPRYAVAVAEVRVGPSPGWLVRRVEAAGLRSINNVVDVTNYVLVETGHPLHAFDLDRLGGAELRIRRARAGERLRTLDGEDRALAPDVLVIADARHPQAVGGVMGGASSEVSGTTRRIALESAYFKPTSIRRTSKRLGLKTEASTRFERGADRDAPVPALLRAAALLEQIGAGRLVGPVADCHPSTPPRVTVTLRRARIERLVGYEIPDAFVERVLRALGFELTRTADGWAAGVPSWRVDVFREADLIEEVARHRGYGMIPTTFPALDRLAPPPDPRIERARLVRWLLTAAGFHEAIAFSFIEAEAAGPFAEGADRVDLAYPLSEKFAVMRPSLLAGLLDALAQNRRRGCRDVRLFEIGACYSHQRGEHRRIGLVWTGAAVPGHWTGPGRPVDLFDLKGVVERLLATLRVKARSVAAERSPFVRGRTAELVDGETKLGVVGQVDPSLAERRDLPAADEIFAAELDLDAIGRVADTTEVHFAPLPRFPSVGRDVSVLLDETLTAVTVRETIRGASPATLVSVVEFDRYRGEGIPEGKVSLSFRLTFRSPDRTLTDREVQEAMDAIVGALAREHGAVQR